MRDFRHQMPSFVYCFLKKSSYTSATFKLQRWKYRQFFLSTCKNKRFDIEYLQITIYYKMLCIRIYFLLNYPACFHLLPGIQK